ncbi:AcrR family transcriptional regulator [Xanthobacter flavus]|uniref:AcrR family transcriptional regulator n=1 Tax=Xanthobacter flavus TaxID=281 RepID=A0A9W6FLV3_XANFL|nr:TetR/AcrR family transcriptional regulator [Xanthobacter flavus]MBN8918651.1 TetR/AcrR family transcriptional regulator [Hyphomicrobiales bacterium]MDR6336713.1 AcrR family transcriptional regulator [Xanthobacter flavus]GLI25244.1 TetR family transcriptional regulator [Xanthobacter flavus]
MARTRAQDYEAKREAILHKSAELFAQYGYSGTSITMIADACGASKALLYHYYPDKEAVLFDILSSHLEQLIAGAEKAIADAPVGGRIYAMSASLLDAYKDADAEHQVQIANLKLLNSDRQEALRALERKLVTLLADAIAEEVPSVGRGPMLKPVTMSAFGMLNWQYLWFRDGKGLTRADYARLVTGLIKAGAEEALRSMSAPESKAADSRPPEGKPAQPRSAPRRRTAPAAAEAPRATKARRPAE